MTTNRKRQEIQGFAGVLCRFQDRAFASAPDLAGTADVREGKTESFSFCSGYTSSPVLSGMKPLLANCKCQRQRTVTRKQVGFVSIFCVCVLILQLSVTCVCDTFINGLCHLLHLLRQASHFCLNAPHIMENKTADSFYFDLPSSA